MFEHSLEERCHEFGKRVRKFCREVKIDPANLQDIKQLVRASGSVGANYIEANENVGDGDLRFRVKICQKESKECMHFLGLVELFGDKELEDERLILIDEANQMRKIFSKMLININKNSKEYGEIK